VATPQAAILYLHGFASSPRSRKARFFQEKLHAEGYSVETLDLAPGDFEHLTLTSQLAVVEAAAQGKPVILIGSSMGGYLAALFAQTHPEVARLLLLAPAFAFYALWVNELGPERMAEWRKNGTIPVFHYGEGREMDLRYALVEDAQLYDPFPVFPQPCMIFHGTQDAVVPVSMSQKCASGATNVSLKLLASGHELTDVLDEIWKDAKPFLLDGIAGR